MLHRVEDYTVADLEATINSDFQTDATKAECIVELLHRILKEQEGIEDVMSQ